MSDAGEKQVDVSAIAANNNHYDTDHDAEKPFDAQVLSELPLDAEKTVAGRVPWSSWLIVATELCERLAFYGASLIFVPYLIRELGMDKAQATAINRGFLFFAYFTAIVGAIIADVKWGKYRTVLVFSIVYMIGLIMLSASASAASITSGFGLPGFIIATYVFMACGTGGIKANVSAFVADQVIPGFTPTKTPGVYADSRLTLEGVFRYFYWAINVGAVIGMAVSPQIARNVNSDQPGKG
ncbi:POT family-domain-containing protein, partial [Thamnocephalis sphaerospora]